MINDDCFPHFSLVFFFFLSPPIFQDVDQAIFAPRAWWEPQSWNLSPIAPRQRTSFTVTLNLHSATGTAPRWWLGRNMDEMVGIHGSDDGYDYEKVASGYD